jgi:hypothetical protein
MFKKKHRTNKNGIRNQEQIFSCWADLHDSLSVSLSPSPLISPDSLCRINPCPLPKYTSKAGSSHQLTTRNPSASWIVEPTQRASNKKLVPNRFPPRTLPCSLPFCGHANLFLSRRLHLMSCQIRLIAQKSLLDGNYREK